MRKFWNIKRVGNTAELTLYGEISDVTWFGDEITPEIFRNELNEAGDVSTINVYINSPGGDVFAGFAIYNMLKRHPAEVIIYVDGMAASAASVVAMAGDRIIMPQAAQIMIHKACTTATGNSDKMLSIAEELKRIDNQLIDIYVDRTKISIEEITEWVRKETWFTGEEAIEVGFADELEENKKIVACADLDKWLDKYNNPPKAAEGLKRKDPCNGGGIQPVEEHIAPQKAEAIEAQKGRFLFYKKIMEGDQNESL